MINPKKMSIQEIAQNFYRKNIKFALKNNNEKTIFVEDILNKDGEPELTLIGDNIENKIVISDIVSTKVI